MSEIHRYTYREWTIKVKKESNLCSSFSFNIIAPSGYSQHVSMGGDNIKRAFERAREMVDMEIELARE